MYTGVQNTLGGGSVLRWTGNKRNPFQFQTVGRLDNDAANITVHDNRLFVGTWSPTMLSSTASLFDRDAPPAAIWMSPELGRRGLKWWDSFGWDKVWEVTDYEPDEAIATSYGLGELISYDGDLYWGTMNPPFSGFSALLQKYGELANIGEAQMKSSRAVGIFRGRDFDDRHDPPEVELLYGEKNLFRYTPASGSEPEKWELVENNMGGADPLYGASGFDLPTTNYTWSTAVYDDMLLFGTNAFGDPVPGANLWAFLDGDSPAILVDDAGLTTPLNEGIRMMISTPDAVYLGMTNGANLSPEGGWELIRLERVSDSTPDAVSLLWGEPDTYRAVPEPSTLILLALGLGTLAFFNRRVG